MQHLKLDLLLENGDICVSDISYIGLAQPDGVEVHLGCIGDEDQIESYLQDYPTPLDW